MDLKRDHGGIRHEDLPWLITGIVSAAAGMVLMITGYRKSAEELLPGGQNSQTIGGTILMAAGAVILIWLIVNDRKRSSQSEASPSGTQTRHITVPAEGFITAKIIGITRNLRMAGEREKFIIVCSYTEAGTGISETFSSEPVDKYPGKEIIGKSVKVFLDRTDPGHYKVDLASIQ